MALVQQKMGVEVYISIHPELARIVSEHPESPKATTVLYNRYGLAFPDPGQIQGRLKRLMIELGYFKTVMKTGVEKRETTYKFHGLRKLSSCHLVEAGGTPHEVWAINGMDIQTVIHYTGDREEKALARFPGLHEQHPAGLRAPRPSLGGVPPRRTMLSLVEFTKGAGHTAAIHCSALESRNVLRGTIGQKKPCNFKLVTLTGGVAVLPHAAISTG